MSKLSEFVKAFTETTKEQIAELATCDLRNELKKEILDARIAQFTTRLLERLKVSKGVKFLMDVFFIPNIGIFTQCIYDSLKAKITGVTKEKTV